MAAPRFPVTSYVLRLAQDEAEGRRFRSATEAEKRNALRAAGVPDHHHDAFIRGRHDEINVAIDHELRTARAGVRVTIEHPDGTVL